MNKMNGSSKEENKILQKFNRSFNIYHLYEYCYKKYKKNGVQNHQKYANLFSYIHLMNTRSVQQQKQQQFIKEWKNVIENKGKFNYITHLQELIKLLEIIDEKVKQVKLFIQFLNDISSSTWQKLEHRIISGLQSFREKIELIFKSILLKEQSKINGDMKDRLKFLIETTIDNPDSNKQQSEAIKQANVEPSSKTKQPLDSNQQKQNASSNPYQVSTMKFFVKEKPTAVKLLTKEQLDNLRREIIQRKKSNTITVEGSVRGSDKATSFKLKSQNYNTYHTEISEDSDECSSQEGEEGPKTMFTSSKKVNNANNRFNSLNRHHRSNFQDANFLKKLFDGKENNLKYNSIQKIQGMSNLKHNKTIEQAPSRYTIQTSSINRFVTENNNLSGNDTSIKKSRMNKISIMGRLERTIKKIQIKSLKKPRGGVIILNDKQKEIDDLYRKVQLEDSDEDKSSKSSDSNSQSNKTALNQNINSKLSVKDSKRMSEIIQSSSQKEQNKYKRRFGVSTKKLNSNKSIDWYSLQAKNLAQKHKNSDVSRTSIFRSSGSNFEEKKSIVKSKYKNDSHKVVKLSKEPSHYYEDRESKDYEELAKRWALSKKSNQRLNTQPNIFNIDKRAIVSSSQMIKVLGEIHEQDKLDRSSKYQEYFDDIFRRKFEGGARLWNQEHHQCVPATFKIENQAQQRQSTKPKTLKKQEKLFDFMLNTIKISNNLQLRQIGIQNTDECQ